MDRIYLDNAATAPLRKTALDAMMPYFTEEFGNPSAIYSYGQTAKNAVEKCRGQIARALGALPTEIFFTSCGTESNNWVLRSVARMKKSKGKHIVSTEIEHNAVRRTLEQLGEDGYEITYLKPDPCGRISPEALEAAIREDTVLISVMLANNVVGTVQFLPALTAVAKKHRILFHTDAVQAVGNMPVNVRMLGVDFLSLSAHKFGGPKGVGALYCRLPNRLAPYLTGGGQERESRSGTENVPGIVGMTKALEESVLEMEAAVSRKQMLADRLKTGLLAIPGVSLTGDPVHRLPGFCSFLVEGIPHSVYLVNALNEMGICVSSGSACSAASREASHVLLAMGYPKEAAGQSLRISIGSRNTEGDVDTALAAVGKAIVQVRAMKPQF